MHDRGSRHGQVGAVAEAHVLVRVILPGQPGKGIRAAGLAEAPRAFGDRTDTEWDVLHPHLKCIKMCACMQTGAPLRPAKGCGARDLNVEEWANDG